jgi:creatinine amidohydrolase/Fe(II)-dependent formamide hydrolase-like protein
MELKFGLGRQIESGAWWEGTDKVFQEVCTGPCPGIGHAGEGEGSCITALRPDLVRPKWGMVPGITDDPVLSTAEKGWHILNGGAEILAKRYEALYAKPGREVIGIMPVPVPAK